MLLLDFVEKLMIKRHTVTSACNGRWRKRRSSAVRTLVAETLVLAKTHGYVEKIEDELERELQRDFSDLPQEKLLRCRRTGDKIFKSKHMLLTVVILCIVDCALVLGELALDLYKVKATLENSERLKSATETFIVELLALHPVINEKTPFEIFSMLLDANVIWSIPEYNYSAYMCTGKQPAAFSTENTTLAVLPVSSNMNASSKQFGGDSTIHSQYDVEIIGEIAHIFHYCSIAILAVIMAETILKAVCAGQSFFHRKIEVFDAFVVVMSFLMDFSFLVFLHDIDTKDFVFILAILLPWRVIRVVNSLIVSVKDHEHFRLKLVYKRKKKIQGTLRDTEAMLQKYMNQSTALQRLCIMEGIEEWKIDNYLKSKESVPPTPMKKKFKFKFDEPKLHLQGYNRAKRCSLPSLDFHALKLPTKSKLSLPTMAHYIKQHMSMNISSRRSSLAANAKYNANGDLHRRKVAGSDDLCTMQEEESENEDSVVSSRATSLSGDVFSRISVSGSIDSDRTLADTNCLSRKHSESVDDEIINLAKMQATAKRRHSESTIDQKKSLKVNLLDLADIIAFKTSGGKTITKPKNYLVCKAQNSDHQDKRQKGDKTTMDIRSIELDNTSALPEKKGSVDDIPEIPTENAKPEERETFKTDAKDNINKKEQINVCTESVGLHIENEIQNGKNSQNL